MDQSVVHNETDERAHQEIIGELRRNRELMERIFASTEKTRRYIFWLHVVSVVKIVLIIVPIVIGIMIMGPLLKNLQNVLSIYTGGNLDALLDENSHASPLKNLQELQNILNEN